MKPITPGSSAHAIVEEELRLLARVTSTLSEISSRGAGAPDFDAALVDLRDQVAEAKPEDIPALVEQMARIAAVAQRYGKGQDLPVDPDAPYFAHLRLEEDDRNRDVLIGKRGFIDRERGVMIVDWRNAPISRLYYRYEEGDDYDERIGQVTLEGWVRARRNLTIEQRCLRRIGCPLGTFVAHGADGSRWVEAEVTPPTRLSGGQGKAARPRPGGGPAVGKPKLGVHSGPTLRADKHLPEIAALIDRAQFDLITRPESGLVVLQGGAGSGKTTVALHRVAYLTFALPGRFKPGKMMVIVPTLAMVRYVRWVLPSLGVHNVPVRTADGWFASTCRSLVRGAPEARSDEAPAAVLRLKKHPLMLRLLEEVVARQAERVGADLASRVARASGGREVVARWEAERRAPLVERIRSVRRWARESEEIPRVCVQQADKVLRPALARHRDLLCDWAEVLTDPGLLSEAVGRHAPGTFTVREVAEVSRWCAQQLGDDPPEDGRPPQGRRRRAARTGEADQAENDPYISLDGRDERRRDPGFLDPPDDALLLYLALLKFGELAPRRGRPLRLEHLVLDEAQDLSVPQVRVLLACTSRIRSVTLAGDTAQRTVFDNGFSDWGELLDRCGVQGATRRTLRLGYRSTEPIMAMARSFTGEDVPQDELRPTRGGAEVSVIRVGHRGEAVATLAEALRSLVIREPRASVALITRHPGQARLWAEDLRRAEVPSVRLVENHAFSFAAGIEVTDVGQVKGLEFDYVVLLDVNADTYPDTLPSRHLLHIAATRAAHQLWIMSVGDPSPVLPVDT